MLSIETRDKIYYKNNKKLSLPYCVNRTKLPVSDFEVLPSQGSEIGVTMRFTWLL